MATFLSLSLTFIVLGLSLYVLSFWCKSKQVRGSVLPPGTKGWPIIGETLEFFQLSQRGNPEKFVTDRMSKYSPKAFITSLMGEKMVVLCGDSGNKFLFLNDNIFNTWLPPSIAKVIISHENRHRAFSEYKKEVSNITNVLMRPEVLQKKFVSIMDYMSKQHIKKEWAPHRQVLAYKLAKKYTFGLACRLFVSIEDPKDVARLKGLYESVTNGIVTIPINFPGTPFNRAFKSACILRKEFLAIIKQRKLDILNKKTDMKISEDQLSHLLLSTYEDGGEFPNDMVVAEILLGLLIAGYDTTSTTITFIIKYLAEFPDIYAEVLKEQLEIANNKKPEELLNWEDIKKMKYSWSVANETMRLAPPSQGTFREVITDFTYAGFTIPKGWKAHWTVHSTNKNPEYFKNPENFDPGRFYENRPKPYAFAPFGGGTHMCPGREYARVKILVFIHNLVTQFELEKLLPDGKIIYTIGAVPTSNLPIRLHPRNGQSN